MENSIPQLHFKVHKPFGMLSQLHSNDTKESTKKRFLSELMNFPDGIMPIGRLDEKSEGLLLLTTDGKLSDSINRSGIEKEYYAQLDGIISEMAILDLQKGVEIGINGSKYTTQPCLAFIIPHPIVAPHNAKIRIGRHRPSSWVSIIIKEGKNRQIRKMTAAVGFPTLRLIRVRIGNICLGDLKPGKVQQLHHQVYNREKYLK